MPCCTMARLGSLLGREGAFLLGPVVRKTLFDIVQGYVIENDSRGVENKEAGM